MRNFMLIVFGVLAVAVACLLVVQDPVKKTSDPHAVAQNFITLAIGGNTDKAIELFTPSQKSIGYATIKALQSSVAESNVSFQDWKVSGTTAMVTFDNTPALQMTLTEQGGQWYVSGVGQAQPQAQ